MKSGNSSTCGLRGFPEGFAGAHPHSREQSGDQALTRLCKQPAAGLFGEKKKKKRIVVECLVDLEVNLRKQEQSAAPYI